MYYFDWLYHCHVVVINAVMAGPQWLDSCDKLYELRALFIKCHACHKLFMRVINVPCS